jgi:hypothetical protein
MVDVVDSVGALASSASEIFNGSSTQVHRVALPDSRSLLSPGDADSGKTRRVIRPGDTADNPTLSRVASARAPALPRPGDGHPKCGNAAETPYARNSGLRRRCRPPPDRSGRSPRPSGDDDLAVSIVEPSTATSAFKKGGVRASCARLLLFHGKKQPRSRFREATKEQRV